VLVHSDGSVKVRIDAARRLSESRVSEMRRVDALPRRSLTLGSACS
jgi:hypothetical protein